MERVRESRFLHIRITGRMLGERKGVLGLPAIKRSGEWAELCNGEQNLYLTRGSYDSFSFRTYRGRETAGFVLTRHGWLNL